MISKTQAIQALDDLLTEMSRWGCKDDSAAAILRDFIHQQPEGRKI